MSAGQMAVGGVSVVVTTKVQVSLRPASSVTLSCIV
jgi:hypothetical protein